MGKLFFLSLVVTVFLSSCATLKKEECLTANWYQIGFEDGTRGYDASRVGQHRKACSKYNVAPDFDLYQQGRDQGLINYCTPHKGYQLGLSGRHYNGVCSGPMEAEFQTAYNIGRDIYLFDRQIKQEEREQDKRDKDIKEIEDRIAKKEAALPEDCKNQATCKTALDEIRELDKQKIKLQKEIQIKSSEIKSMKQTLYDMKHQNRF